MQKIKAYIQKNIPTAALVLYAVFLVTLAIRIVASYSTALADFFNRYVSSLSRALFAWVTAPFPFSVAETLLLAALPAGVKSALHLEGIISAAGGALPFAEIGLGWVCPAAVGLVIGLVLHKVRPQKE